MQRRHAIRFLALFLAIPVLLGVMTPYSLSAEPGDAFDLRHVIAGPQEYFFTVVDPEGQAYSSMALQPAGVEIGGTRGQWKNCYGPKDPVCLENPNARTAFLALGLCESAVDEDCVADLKISRKGGPFESAKFLRRLDSNLTMDPEPSMNFPGGSTASLWQEADDPSKKYLVLISYGGGFWDNQFFLNSMTFSIIPVRESTGDYKAARIYRERDPCCRIEWGSDYRALWTEEGRAGFRVNFDDDVELSLTARVKKDFSGWFKGRIKDPAVQIDSFTATNDSVQVRGKPVTVAVLGVKRKVSEMSPQEFKWFQNNGSANATTPTRPDATDIFEFIENFRSDAKDAALGITTAWSIGSTSWGNDNACLNDKSRLVGIVSTNAMGFEGTSPRFIDGGLEYRVASVHYGPDGKTPLRGTYDLLLRSDVARCLYGFSSAPVAASISIQGQDGVASVATSSMTEQNGWLKFGAYGFTFSEKKIRIALTQEKSESSSVTTIVSEATSSSSKSERGALAQGKKLICTKNKKRKEFTARTKCPRGYRAVVGSK